VFSPKVLLKGQPDPTNLQRFAQDIYAQANAVTPRQRAEAIWRYFLTDGRYVAPGFWYHIAGWAYEEPMGEVLDPLKLMNSYGFGLCYQIAPLLEAVYRAGGFEDARTWFLTGHTVTEVFYDGAYHYYDSDMMGYTTLGSAAPQRSTVASVHQLELDGSVILSKLKGPRDADAKQVEYPWYPADVREGAMKDLAELFTTSADNSLYTSERAPQGYSPAFVLRPGERLMRYFQPERRDLFYLPYKFDGKQWTEFPRNVPEYKLFVADGPHSEKDARTWGTGVLEYRPKPIQDATQVIEVQSPYVIINAEFEVEGAGAAMAMAMAMETSTDGGRTWHAATRIDGAPKGATRFAPAVLTRSEHGTRNAVGGSYGYLLRVTRNGAPAPRGLLLRTRVELNPRTLPALQAGHNELTYSSGPRVRRVPRSITAKQAAAEAVRITGANYVEDGGQGYWIGAGAEPAEALFRLRAPDGGTLTGFDAGGRFLDLSRGMAPDKFTAEVRKVQPVDSSHASASIAWSRSADGPFETLWEFDPKLTWKDGTPIDRVLRWPEVDRHVNVSGATDVYVRYRFAGLAADDFRLASEAPAQAGGCKLALTHVYTENGVRKTARRLPPPNATEWKYSIDTAPGAKVENVALEFECN
jgi:hypothetical protein